MQHIKIKYLSIAVLAFYIASPLLAQETINQDVRVVREYNPTISDAFKINEMPAQSDTIKANPVFRYQLKGKAIVNPPETIPLVPAKIAKEPAQELYPSYVKGYLGNYSVLGGELLYNLVQNKDYALALKASHESSWGDLELENKIEADAPYHETNAGVYFRRFFNKKTLSFDLGFNNYVYNYYGMYTIDPLANYLPTIGSDYVLGSGLIPERKQRQTAFDINLGLLNNINSNDEYRYDINFGFSTFGNLSGVKENQVCIKADLFIPVEDLNFKVEAAVDYAGSKFGSNDSPAMFIFQKRQQTLFQINPSLITHFENADLKLGLRIAGEFDDMGDSFYLSPDILANVSVAEGVISLEGGITGDINRSSYRYIMEENPFVSPDVNVKTAFHSVRFFAGIKGNFSSTTSFAARMDYSIFQDEHFFVNRTFINSDNASVNYNNLFDVAYDDGSLLRVSGEFKVKPVSELDIVLHAAYYGWNLDSLEYAWHKPDMEIGLSAAYKFSRDLTVSAAINILGERYAQVQSVINSTEVKTLDSVFDFNLGAKYTLNSRWDFFADVHNLFASKYYMYQGYPMHGVNFRAGVGYSF